MTASRFDTHPALIIHLDDPLNAGPPLDLLRQYTLTPTELFYVRNHGSVPQIDGATYRCTVSGLTQRQISFSLDELRARFSSVTQLAALQCAGNRRSELVDIRPIPGETPWAPNAISAAAWRGVLLRDVLDDAGILPDAQHVAFLGLDSTKQANSAGLGGSIPLAKALQPEVLLAYEMNGAPLSPAHGFPLRVVAPGYIGARSVKWLASISVQAEPSDNYFQAHAYKLFPPHITKETADWERGLMLGELSLNAAICAPTAGARLRAGRVLVQGYALAGGGRSVERVDLSIDGGETWRETTLLAQPTPWLWRFWETTLDVAPGLHEIVCARLGLGCEHAARARRLFVELQGVYEQCLAPCCDNGGVVQRLPRPRQEAWRCAP